jgi:hypothetical protein
MSAVSIGEIDRELVHYIEGRTVRPTTAYEFVVRSIALQVGTGLRPTFRSVTAESLAMAKRANIGDLTFDSVYDAWPEVLAALRSSDPMQALQI